LDPGAAGNIGLAMVKGSLIVFAMVAMAYPIYRVVSMWLDRSMEANEAVLYLTVLLFLFLGIIVGGGTPLGWLLLAALIVGCLGLPLLNHAADRMALRRMEDEDIRNFSETLRHQPRNVYLRERLGRIFLGRREYDLAWAQIKAALDAQPKDPKLTGLLERIDTERRREQEHLRLCPKCAAENPDSAAACRHCGFRFIDPGDLLRALWSEPALQAIKWSGLGTLGAGLVVLVAGVSMALAGLLLVTGSACLFWYLYAHFSRM
jgi:hypothetical protein